MQNKRQDGIFEFLLSLSFTEKWNTNINTYSKGYYYFSYISLALIMIVVFKPTKVMFP